MSSTETKAEKLYYWSVFLVGFGEVEERFAEGTRPKVRWAVTSISHTDPRGILLDETQDFLINAIKGVSPYTWGIASIFPCGQTDPDTIQPDGKEHEFVVTTEVYTADALIPKFVTVSVKGPHALFPAMPEFIQAVKTAAVGKLEGGVVIRCINPL